MSILGRILEVGMFSKMLVEKSIFRRVLPSLVGVMALAVITGMMLFTVLLGIFYLAFHLMVSSGIAPAEAGWIVAVAFIGITVIFVLLTIRAVRWVRRDLKPAPANLRSIIDAFLNGVMK